VSTDKIHIYISPVKHQQPSRPAEAAEDGQSAQVHVHRIVLWTPAHEKENARGIPSKNSPFVASLNFEETLEVGGA
jgi:hypothetical protein